MEDADMNLALKASVFATVGTAAQRCTSLRRIFLHESIYDTFVSKMAAAYKTISVGDPTNPDNFLGPLHTKKAVRDYLEGIEKAKSQGGKVICGGKVIPGEGNYVEPTIIEISHSA